MQILVIYDSKFGNTERIAQAIARGIGAADAAAEARVLSTADAAALADPNLPRPGLLVVGGPTHNHGESQGLKAFTRDLPAALRGLPTATFDTRYRGPVLLMGSAAGAAAKALASEGNPLVAAAASFFVGRGGSLPVQRLEPGELERAEAWGRALGATVASPETGSLAAR